MPHITPALGPLSQQLGVFVVNKGLYSVDILSLVISGSCPQKAPVEPAESMSFYLCQHFLH